MSGGHASQGRSFPPTARRVLWVVSPIIFLVIVGLALDRLSDEPPITDKPIALVTDAPSGSPGADDQAAPQDVELGRLRDAMSQRVDANVSQTRVPPVGLARVRSKNWPPRPDRASDPLTRAAVSQTREPPFGPILLPAAVGLEEQIAFERDYYLEHSDEYERFVSLFGDVHGLR